MGDTVPLEYQRREQNEMVRSAREFADRMATRRSVRTFSPDPLPDQVVREAVRAASTAPSGANLQPWHFVVVSEAELKQRIRQEAEAVEQKFYSARSTENWRNALQPLGTDPEKAFLTEASHLIVPFIQRRTMDERGVLQPNYYVRESIGIAVGMMISCLHLAGAVMLTYTPGSNRFLRTLLERPQHEVPYMILVTGYPTADTRVPDLRRKPPEDTVSWR